MALLRRLRNWTPRFRLLFAHPTPEVAERLNDSIDHLEHWLIRDGRGDWDIPRTIDAAQDKIRATVADLRALTNLLPLDDYPVRLVVDTNALIDNPDLAAYTGEIGGKYVAYLLPVVLGEIDDLKRSGRTPELRNNARRAERRLKGIRTNGNVLEGVRVAGQVIAKFEHTEPRSDDLPGWLDMDVPDDRFVAATLLLQSAHPGSAIYVATSDINMQTKLSAVGLPYVEPPPVEEESRGELRRDSLRCWLSALRDLDVIESELRLIAAVRRTAAEVGAPAPRIDLVDELLDEWMRRLKFLEFPC